jgi:HEAT repeat protein
MLEHRPSPDQLVDWLGDKTRRNDTIRALVGGLTATELRRVRVSPEAKAALIRGLKHRNSKIRWWCIQLMDHIADESYLQPLLDAAYTDPTPKNRRHAIHALACEKCKPDGCRLRVDIRDDLRRILSTDPDVSVRETARLELAELEAEMGYG